jgi:hypothetical protein
MGSARGAVAETYRRVSGQDLAPQKIADGLAFMFATRLSE